MGREKWALFIAVCSEIVFGLSFIFIKMCVDTISVFTLLSWRSIIAFTAMTLCALLGIVKIDLRGKDLRPLFLLSLFQPVLYFIMETLGVRFTNASESGTLLSCVPIITMLFSAVFLKDRPNRRQVLFMLISVAGAVMIGTMNGFTASSSAIGYLFLLVAMYSESAYAITSQKIKNFNSAEKTYGMIISGTVVFTGCALIEQGVKGNTAGVYHAAVSRYRFSDLYLVSGNRLQRCSLFLRQLRHLRHRRNEKGRLCRTGYGYLHRGRSVLSRRTVFLFARRSYGADSDRGLRGKPRRIRTETDREKRKSRRFRKELKSLEAC